METIPLLVSSILSKKLAAGLHGLAMDAKFGSGAFLPDYAKAQALAQALVEVANGAGLPTTALLTHMGEPLASAAGNALEVAYAPDHLTGRRREPRFHEVTVALGTEMLALAGSLPIWMRRAPRSRRPSPPAPPPSVSPVSSRRSEGRPISSRSLNVISPPRRS
ncbi:Thymidine phosphorylase [Bosea thiooxidans]